MPIQPEFSLRIPWHTPGETPELSEWSDVDGLVSVSGIIEDVVELHSRVLMRDCMDAAANEILEFLDEMRGGP